MICLLRVLNWATTLGAVSGAVGQILWHTWQLSWTSNKVLSVKEIITMYSACGVHSVNQKLAIFLILA